jgi:hypothetical protein
VISRAFPSVFKWIVAAASTLLALPLAGQQSEHIMYNIRSEYDAPRGKTILHLDRTRADSVTELSAVAVFDGRRTAGQPQNDVVIVTLQRRANELANSGNTMGAVVYADADAIAWTGRASLRRTPSDGFPQTVFLAIPFRVFQSLANADSIAIALDGHVIRLGVTAKTAIREYARRMTSTEPD